MTARLPASLVPAMHHGIWRNGMHGPILDAQRTIAEETPVAICYNGSTYAVMMATPQDLQDFAVGFSLVEGLIAQRSDILSLDVLAHGEGVEVRIWLASEYGDALSARRRKMTGPTGCGLCGIDSLAEAIRPVRVITAPTHAFRARDIAAAMASLPLHQRLHQATGVMHAAAFWTLAEGMVEVREDVGRHNALDKLAGALATADIPAASGAVLLTSRVSVDLVQKAAMMNVPLIAAVSAPTALAIRTADRAGITLVALVRDDGFQVFSHPGRLATD